MACVRRDIWASIVQDVHCARRGAKDTCLGWSARECTADGRRFRTSLAESWPRCAGPPAAWREERWEMGEEEARRRCTSRRMCDIWRLWRQVAMAACAPPRRRAEPCARPGRQPHRNAVGRACVCRSSRARRRPRKTWYVRRGRRWCHTDATRL